MGTCGMEYGNGKCLTVTMEKWLGKVFEGNTLRMYSGRTPFVAGHGDRQEPFSGRCGLIQLASQVDSLSDLGS